MRTIFKIFSYFILGLLGLLIVLTIFSQTSWFRSILKDQIVSISKDFLNGELSIGKINGNFYSDLAISEVKIEKNDTTLIYIDQISLNYNLSAVLFKTIIIDLVKIDSVFAFLKQENDSTWNLSKIVKESTPEEPDTVESEFNWNIETSLFEILNTELRIEPNNKNSTIPKRIKNLNFLASVHITPNEKSFSVYTFTLKSENPSFEIMDLDISAKINEEKIELEKFELISAENKLMLTAKYFQNDSNISEIELRTNHLNFSEFRPFFPELLIETEPILNISGKYHNDKANIIASLIDSSQSIATSLEVKGIDSIPSFNLEIEIDSIELAKWIGNSEIKSNLNAIFEADGSGNSLESLETNSIIRISESVIADLELDSMIINTEIKNKNLESVISLVSEFGDISGKVNLKGIEKQNEFNINLNMKSFNISPIINDENFKSDINFDLMLKGAGFDPASMSAELVLNASKSSVLDYSVNSINSIIYADNGSYFIENFNFKSDYADLNLSGEISLMERNNIKFELLPKEIASIPPLSKIENISLEGRISGNAQGYIDSISGGIDFSLDDIGYQKFSIENINGRIDLSRINDSINSSIRTKISVADLEGTKIEHIDFNAEYDNHVIKSELFVDINDTANAEIMSEIILDSVITLLVNKFNFEISDYQWQNIKDTLEIKIADGKFDFHNFNLSNNDQSILIDGFLNQANTSDLKLKIENFNIGDLINVVKKDFNLTAVLNADMNLKGNLNQPDLIGKLDITGLNYENEIKGSMKTDVKLKDEKLEYDFEMLVSENSIVSNGFVPLILAADDSSSVIPGNKPLDISFKVDVTNFSPFMKYVESVGQFEGKIESDLKLSNDLNNLDVNGFFKFNGSNIISDTYGISYNNVEANFEFENKKYYLREFLIKNEEGKFKMDGFAEFKDTPLSGNPNNFEIGIEAEEFEIAKSRNLEAKIDGNLDVKNDDGDAKFSGDISILRSRVNLPYFTGEASANEFDNTKPLLVRELEKSKIGIDSLGVNSEIAMDDSTVQNEFIKNIGGKFRLRIPNNTWIVSPDLNIELSGELDVVKNGEVFELFGNMETVRGKLAIFSKEFSILTGQIIFNGGSDFDPGLNIQLDYMFRGSDKSKRYLELFIRGTLKKPELAFSVDDKQIDEGNAVSYLLFGKGLDELSQSQKSNVKTSNEDLAKTIAGNLVASQLQTTIGDALGLDVIEIKGENNWNKASLSAGKYLTDDLYVSYARGFGNSETNEVNPSIVTLEYGLTSFLFIQLVEGSDKTEGFDLIFKFDF